MRNIFAQSEPGNLSSGAKDSPPARKLLLTDFHLLVVRLSFSPAARHSKTISIVNIHPRVDALSILFLFTTRVMRFQLDSEDFIDSLADFGIQCVFKFFTKTLFLVSLRAQILCALAIGGRKKKNVALRFCFYSCVMSRAFHLKNFFFMLGLFMQSSETYILPCIRSVCKCPI